MAFTGIQLFLATLNGIIPLILLVAVGAIAAGSKVFPPEKNGLISGIIFKCTFPISIVYTLGIIDMNINDIYIVVCFFIMLFILLPVSLVLGLMLDKRENLIAATAHMWSGTTLTNSVAIGQPLLAALFNEAIATKYAFLQTIGWGLGIAFYFFTYELWATKKRLVEDNMREQMAAAAVVKSARPSLGKRQSIRPMGINEAVRRQSSGAVASGNDSQTHLSPSMPALSPRDSTDAKSTERPAPDEEPPSEKKPSREEAEMRTEHSAPDEVAVEETPDIYSVASADVNNLESQIDGHLRAQTVELPPPTVPIVPPKIPVGRIICKSLLNTIKVPMVIGVLLGILYNIIATFGYKGLRTLPYMLEKFFVFCGALTAPGLALMMGLFVYNEIAVQLRLKKQRLCPDKHFWAMEVTRFVIMTLLRQLVAPLILLGLMLGFRMPPSIIVPNVLLCGVPTGVFCYPIAVQYKYFSISMAMSVNIQLVTIVAFVPILYYICLHIFGDINV